jgi:hypothetical protein
MAAMKTKAVENLEVGDKVMVRDPNGVDPNGVGVVRRKQKSRLFSRCWRLDIKVVEGPNKGEWIKDQHFPDFTEVEIPE